MVIVPMLPPRTRCILLNLIPGAGFTRWRLLLERFGGLDRLWDAGQPALRQAGVSLQTAAAIAAARSAEAQASAELALAERHKARIITWVDADYPEPLRTIPDPPLALYVWGGLRPDDDLAVAIVGSRRATAYGLQCARRLSGDLARQGLAVISGLAYGIDAEAHRAALEAGGRTIAVLGSGLARLYPVDHRRLAEDIAARGAVLTEYPMQTAPLAEHFPRRNRLISGLALGVVVVEASNRSGSLITANCALEQGREVFAVPGPIGSATSEGAHGLLKDGARLVTGVDDILEELRLAAAPVLRPVASRLPAASQQVLEAIPDAEAVHIDAIAEAAGFLIAEVAASLLELEIQGVVRQLPGKYFARK